MSLTSVWHFGGAVQRVAADATAFGDRSMPYMLSIDSIWSKPEDDDANIAWSRDFWSAMQRHSTGRLYLNFAGHGEDADLVRQAHGAEVYAQTFRHQADLRSGEFLPVEPEHRNRLTAANITR